MAGSLGPAVCYPIRTLECTSLRVETGDWTALSHGLLAGLLLRSFLSVLPSWARIHLPRADCARSSLSSAPPPLAREEA